MYRASLLLIFLLMVFKFLQFILNNQWTETEQTTHINIMI